MEFLKTLWKNIYFRNILFIFITVIVLLILSSVALDFFTRHGESEPVPDFKGKTMDSALIIAKKANLRLEIIDSIFRVDAPRGAVFVQNPEAGVHVKKNRKIFLTINSLAPKKEPVPNVVGVSLRQAKAELNNFRIGSLQYVNDFATNQVLEQRYRNKKIEPGIWLSVGEYIDLKLGLDSTTYDTFTIPNVEGLTRLPAEDMIIENSLNYTLVFDRTIQTVSDSLNAVVYKQEPPAGTRSYYGNNVKLSLRLPKAK